MPLVTVLIEDSSTIRESLIPALAEVADAEVVAVAETATEGIAALEAHAATWRLAVVDMFLRVGNGLEVLRAFRVRDSHRHMVVLTNYATPEIRRRAIEAGADAVFDKSTEIDLLFDLCRTYSTG
jgi:DNA-binding NarL/FixJ family response regulator